MKTTELRKLVREEISKIISEAGFIPVPDKPGKMLALKVGQMYQVLDPGMDEWNDEYEYLGFDVNSREHMFRTFDSPVDHYHFVGVTEADLKTDVKPSQFK